MATKNKKPIIPKKKTVKTDEIGGSGTLISHGIISGVDYNPSLSGITGLRAYEEMRNDATVNASLDVIKLPILAANWFVESGDKNDDKFQEHADFIKQELFSNIEYTFTEFLREALSYLDYGRYAFEIVYKMRDDGQIGWQKFAARMPKTIFYWETEDHKPGIQQILPDGKKASIPMEKLMIFTNRQEGNNYEGRSVLRSSYRNWFTKDALYRIQAIGLERQGVGIPYVNVPKGATKGDIAKAEEFLRNVRANEEAFLTQKPGWEFGFMDMKGMGTMDPSQAIAHHNREIVKNVLAQFLELGASSGTSGGSSGSHALSKDQSRLFTLSLQYVASYAADIITKSAIKRLIDINFGPQEYYPVLCVSKIGETDFAVLATALKDLVGAGLITAEPGTEDYLRDTMSLPELPDDVKAEHEFNDFMDGLDNEDATIDNKQNQVDAALTPEQQAQQDQQTPKMADERKGWVETIFGVRTAKQDPKINKDEPVVDPKQEKINMRKSQHSMDVATARHEFTKAKLDARTQIMSAKASGKKLEGDHFRNMQLGLLKMKGKMLDKVHKANMSAGKDISTITGSEMPDIRYAHELKEQLDHVIEELKTTIGETD